MKATSKVCRRCSFTFSIGVLKYYDVRFLKGAGWQYSLKHYGKREKRVWVTYEDCKYECPYELERMMEDEGV